MVEFKKFRSPGEDIRVASLSGHIALITKELVPIPDFLWKEAYANGAISEDMKNNSMDSYIASKKLEKEQEELLEFEKIKNSLREIKDNPVGYVTSNGDLVHRKAIAAIGRPIKKDVIDKAWKEIVAELED